MTHRILRLAALVVLAATPAGAQDAPVNPGLDTRALSTVFVLDARGAETKGKLLRLDEQAVLILVDGTQRRFELGDVVKVDKRGDSLRNGAISGAVLGLALGGLAAGIADCGTRNGRYADCGAGARIGYVVLSTAVYTAIGTAIDAAVTGRTNLYRKPTMMSAIGVTRRGASVGVTFRW